MGMDVVQVQPKGFELDPAVIDQCKKFAQQNGSSFEISYDMEEAFKDADVVYPKSWGSLECFADRQGKKVDMDKMKNLFEQNKDWICTEEKMKLAKQNCIYMHCLPCDRGQEVTDAVIDGPQSAVFDQAENRLHAQKAIMALTMGGKL